jgi:glycerol-3-phosphate dehydrogenase (NAD(P)+)
MKQVLVIGAGELGQSLTSLLRKNQTLSLTQWDKQAGKVIDQQPLSDVASRAQVMLLCIPSWGMREALSIIAPVTKAEVIVSFAKGIESQENLTMHEVMTELLPGVASGAVGGPMLAEEIEAGLTTRGIVGGPQVLHQTMTELFAGTNLSFAWTQDALGVCLSGVLKNVYAVGFGIADTLKLGSNFNGILMTQALQEMSHVLPMLGAEAATAYSLAGAGDLITTGFSDFSRNRVCGKQLAQTGTCNMDSEGMISIPYLLKRLEGHNLPPFLQAMKNILMDKADVKKTFANVVT